MRTGEETHTTVKASRLLEWKPSLQGRAVALSATGDAMGTMSMMKGGEVVALMPDGHMGMMMKTGDKMRDEMMKASPLDHDDDRIRRQNRSCRHA